MGKLVDDSDAAQASFRDFWVTFGNAMKTGDFLGGVDHPGNDLGVVI